VTDSDTGPVAVRRDRDTKPGITNLLDIARACTGTEPHATTHGALKKLVTEAVVATLEPIQKRYADLAADPGYVQEVYAAGADRCIDETLPVLEAARTAMGLAR
jgi:tryptophanyl-tRNA synthetase